MMTTDPGPTSRSQPTPSPSVVICEDHTIVRAAVRKALEESGIVVRSAVGTLGDARSAWRTFSPDVMLLDLQLPDGSGVELVQEVTAAGSATRVLLLSGVVDPFEIQRAVDAGAGGFLSKFSDQDAIVDAVRRVAVGEEVFDTTSASAVIRAIRSGPRISANDFTERELAILEGMAEGLANNAIARRCGVSPQTIKTQAGVLYRKLGVSDRAGAVAVGFRSGLLD